MPTDQDHEEALSGLPFERIVFFSDAVFAIAITLLALEIRIPEFEHEVEVTASTLAQAVGDTWLSIWTYTLSFLVLGIYWEGHHRMFRFIRRYDAGLLWLNLIYLMLAAFIPFPTSLLKHFNSFSVGFYAACVGLLGVMSTAIWVYASRNRRLVEADLDGGIIKAITARPLFSALLFFGTVPVALFAPVLATVLWLAFALARPVFNRIYGVKV